MLKRFVFLLSVLIAQPVPAATPAIPLIPGLTITTAIAERDGDYESRKRLSEREGDGWRMSYSAVLSASNGEPETMSNVRLLHDDDLRSARSYRNYFEPDVEEDYPGTTALGASTVVLEELRAIGKSRFSLIGESRWMAQALADLPGAAQSPLALAAALTAGNDVSFKGELQRKSAGSLSVLVNGQPQALPVLIASGRFTAKNGHSMDAELSFLDDSANPIALQWRIGDARLRVVRVDFPQPGNLLARTLQRKKRVTLPGLYFDFGSATLRPESSAALPAILEAVRATSGSLLLEGHTDDVGEAAANQTLSLARAEAVRTALVKLDPRLALRFSVQGFGESRPSASNASLEGRAQNRRVELVAP